MTKPTLIALAVTLGLVMTALVSIPAYAQVRTTPVEVTNPLSLSTDGNMVRAQQLGSWSFFLSGGTAAVTQSGTWNVNIGNTPSVSVSNTPNVSVTNTPSVNVANTPTVLIGSAQNTVKTPTQSQTIQLWNMDQVMAPSSLIYSSLIHCAGYKELRLFVASNYCTSVQVTVRVRFRSPRGFVLEAGHADFDYPGEPLTTHANFISSPGTVALTIPVMSDWADVLVSNGSTSSVTIYNDSWAYLVN